MRDDSKDIIITSQVSQEGQNIGHIEYDTISGLFRGVGHVYQGPIAPKTDWWLDLKAAEHELLCGRWTKGRY